MTEDASVLRELAAEHFLFDVFVQSSPRISIRPLVLPRALHHQAVAAAEAAVQVLGGEVARTALEDQQERARYGLGPDVERLAAASASADGSACLVRVDLLLGEDGLWKVCEVNADCPGGHNEAFALPLYARRSGLAEGVNPTVVVDRTVERLARMAQGGAVGLLFATAYAEDLQVCALLRRALRRRGVDAHLGSPSALRRRGSGLELRGFPVRALYRYFPTEYMEGLENLADLEWAVREGRVQSLSAFHAMFLQSKTVMARAWARAEALSDLGRTFLARHLPATHEAQSVSREHLVGWRTEWVLKRSLGRVGDEVFVGAVLEQGLWVLIVDEVCARCSSGERWVAQAYVPQAELATPWGGRLVTLGAYVLDGRFVGYFARLSPSSHVSHDALVVPVFVREDP